MQVSSQAAQKIAEFVSDTEDAKVRIAQVTVGGGCCAKIQLGVTLEEDVEEDDELFVIEGITFIIDKALRASLGEVVVDFSPEQGIVVSAAPSAA